MSEVRTGVYVCHCGTNISATVDVAEFAKTQPHVAVARDYKFMCSQPGMVEMAFRAFDPCFGCGTHSLPGRMPLELRLRESDGTLRRTVRRP